MKTLTESVNEIKNSQMSPKKKAEALIKLGLSKYEAMVLSQDTWRPTPKTTPQRFSYTFGVEIECYHCHRGAFFEAARRNDIQVDSTITYSHNDIPLYKLVSDASLSGIDTAECVTPPLKSTDGFASLKNCCKALDAVGAKVNKSCGLHVHIGAAGLTEQQYCNVFVNYLFLERVIESFLAPSRCGTSNAGSLYYCRSLRPRSEWVLNATTRAEMGQALHNNRYYRVNPMSWSRHKTIEFRQHQGSTNFTKISNWVKFCGKLVEYSKKNRLNHYIERIEDIPFLNEAEKRYFIGRREYFTTHRA